MSLISELDNKAKFHENVARVIRETINVMRVFAEEPAAKSELPDLAMPPEVAATVARPDRVKQVLSALETRGPSPCAVVAGVIYGEDDKNGYNKTFDLLTRLKSKGLVKKNKTTGLYSLTAAAKK